MPAKFWNLALRGINFSHRQRVGAGPEGMERDGAPATTSIMAPRPVGRAPGEVLRTVPGGERLP